MTRNDTQICRLAFVAEGEAELCLRDACAFWEPGGAVLPGGCIIDRLGTDIRRDDLAAFLLDIRRRLERVRETQSTRMRGELQ
jgi:hypothetical protein